MANFTIRLTAYIDVAANGCHLEHLQELCPSPSLHPHLFTDKPALFTATNRLPVKTALKMANCLG